MRERPGVRTLTGDLYDRLRADILTGRIPPGTRLKLGETQQRYGATMGVVREALIRLAEQDLVRSEPQIGFTVTPLSRDALMELTDARVAIECLVLGKAIQHGSTRWEGQAIASHHVLARVSIHAEDDPGAVSDEWEQAHLAFHRALLEGCPNGRLRQIADTLRVSAELYRTWSQTLGEASDRDVNAEHAELLAALLARDLPRATANLESHIRRTTEILLRRVAD